MPLKLMYITNRPDVAKIAEKNGVDRIFVDMEYIGKAERQGKMDTVQNHHTIEDVKNVRAVLNKAELLVRINPIHEATEEYCSSKEEIDAVIEAGADMIVCTGGMSVDPDDKTPLAIRNVCGGVVTYGAPVLPGAMFLLAYYEVKEGPHPRTVAIMGLPGCVMYARRTIFDLVLPHVMADDEVTAQDLAALGEGGLCLNCPVCTFPNCGFGKGH